MKSRFFISAIVALLSLAASFTASAADDAANLIKQCADKLASAPSVKASYVVTLKGQGDARGNLIMSADKFTAAAPGIITWFDGLTQWTYSSSDGEVTIVEPTPEELAQSNPLSVIRSLTTGYKAAMVKSAPGTKSIRLTPLTKKSDYKQIVVTLSASTLLPTQLVANTTDGNVMNLKITSLSIGNPVSSRSFKFDPKRYPNARVNDMR